MADIDTRANALFTSLTAGTDFSLPAVDLSGNQFDLPSEAGNSLYGDVPELTEEDLTTRIPNGSGMFDGLMGSIGAHLQIEYDKGRLSGQDYASAWVGATQSALSAAVQYLLSKDQARYQAALAQKQAQAAEIEVIQRRLQTEITRANLAAARVQTETTAAEYALTKSRLAGEEANLSLTEAQVSQVDYQTTSLMPAQLAGVQAETALTGTRETGIAKETSIADFQLTDMLPLQKTKLQADVDLTGAQESRITYEVNSLLPAELDMLTGQKTKLDFEISSLLPSQLALLDEQMEAQRAQTLDTRSDGTTTVIGTIGTDKAQISAQTSKIEADKAQVNAQTSKIGIEETLVATQKSRLDYEIGSLMPAQFGNVQADTALKNYDVSFVMPQEVSRIQKQIDSITSDISLASARKDQVLYETASILPEQKLKIQADKNMADYQATSLMPAELGKITADTATSTYQKDHILPAQKESILEQMEAHRAKTQDTRSDGTTPIAGAVGKQKDLHAQQVTSYQRDAEAKLGKMILDTWITRKSIDDAAPTPNQIDTSAVGTLVDSLRNNLSL